MKNRKIIVILLLATVFALSLFFASCDLIGLDFGGHSHDYSSDWSHDETHHWRKCKFCSEIASKTEHVFGDWVIDTNPTETSEGARHRDCLICNYTENGVIDALGQDHEHVFDLWVSDDANTHHKECICGERSTEASTNHNLLDWVIDVNPTETEEGLRHRDCKLCDYTETETLDPLGEEHEHVYDHYVSDNAYSHHRECICGDASLDNASPHVYGDWVIDKNATTTSAGLKHKTCTLCSYRYEEVIPQLQVQDDRTVDLYAINDFHGEWAKMSQISGYLTQQRNENANTLFINSGDMFQGSMESNSNYGSLLAACMDDTGFDAFVYGNHEFDWGLDNLRKLASNSQTPYLGANIYNWDRTKGWGDLADFAQEYVIKELDNGLRVGIIGIIGKDQITSISSQLVQTIGFKDPKEVVPSISQKLRNELNCDVVIVSAHTGPETFLEDSSWDITKYADAVFCAHTHIAETYEKNGVPFIQGGSYGKNVSRVSLTVDAYGNVSCSTYQNIPYSYSWPNKFSVDEKINNSNESIKEEANQVLATLSGGYLNSGTAVPRLVAQAIAEYATANYSQYPIELAMVNNARSSLQSGQITYTALYEAIPFDNVVYIAKVSGKDILSEAGYSAQSIWRVTGTAIENSASQYYYIAVIDYLLYHQNANRNYNYFPSAFTSGFDPVPLTKTGVEAYNYRLITRDFLLKQGTVTSSTYTTVNDHTNKDLLQETVTLSLANYATSLVCFAQPNVPSRVDSARV